MQRAGAGRDQHEHHRLGPVGDARQRVEAERRQPRDHAELVPLVGVLARPRRHVALDAAILRRRAPARPFTNTQTARASGCCWVRSSRTAAAGLRNSDTPEGVGRIEVDGRTPERRALAAGLSREPAAAGARDLLPEPADRRPRLDDRQRRAALDPQGPPRLGVGPAVDDRRLHAGAGQPAHAVGLDRGPNRPQARLPRRPGRVLARLAAVRARPHPRAADRVPRPAGDRRVDAQPGGDVDHPQRVRRPARAGPGDRRVGRGVRPEHGARPGARRRAGRLDRLALGVLRQRPDRGRWRSC